MILLKIDQLKPGMILAQSVYNQQELLLFEKGVSLTKKSIWTLKTWGIRHVHIEGGRKGHSLTGGESEEKSKERIENELREKFADVLDEPVMAAIMKAANRQLQENSNDPENGNEPA
jgi:hypothetical protein